MTLPEILTAARALSAEERARLVAHLVAELPGGTIRSIHLGIDAAALAFVAALPDAKPRTGIYARGEGFAIESVDAPLIAGPIDVEMRVQAPERPLADSERAQLAGMQPRVEPPSSYSVGP